MNVNIIDKSSWEKTIAMAVPPESLQDDFDKAFLEFKKNIQIEGFRKGKVPLDLIKKMFGKEIETETAEKKIPDILAEIGKEHNYRLISSPKIVEFSYTKDEGLKFKAELEIVPALEIKKFKSLEVERDIYQISDEDIADELENLQEQQAEMINVEIEAAIGHYVIADFQKLDHTGLPIIGQKYNDRYFQLSKNNSDSEPNLADQLIGIKAGEQRQVKLKWNNEENQHVIDIYNVTVKEIKEKRLPDLDDEFAKDVGDYENLDELKANLKVMLDIRAKQENENLLHERIIDEIVKNNVIEIPEPMLENYLNLIIDNMKKESKQKIDENKIREDYRADAIRQLKWSLASDEICKFENIDVTDEEVDKRIDLLAKADEKGSVQINNYYLKKKNKDKLKDNLISEKLFTFLKEHARIKEKKISRKDLMKESKIIT